MTPVADAVPAGDSAPPRARQPAFLMFALGALFSFASLVLLMLAPGLAILYLVATGVVWIWAIREVVLGRSERRPLVFASGWTIAPTAIFLSFLAWTGDLGDYLYAAKFDPVVFRANADADPDDRTRLRMADDLLESHRLDGLTRESVVALLGEPEWSNWTADDRVCAWRIGPGFMYSQGLRVRFGPDGRVVAYFIRED